MNRVEIVNLGGRAHHIESEGAAAIDVWLHTARISLNGDPDRDDLLLDFERAIGEKCDAQVADGHDVVTSQAVAGILESLGTIEPSGDSGFATLAAAPHAEERARRLYRLPDERMIAGVCSGIGAWLRIDVTVVRLGWVLLPILAAGLTEGASIPLSVALYALLAFVLPRANSPEAKAAAHGHGATAQDRLLQARSGAMPALTSLGRGIGAVIGVALRVLRVLLLIAITALLAVWVVGAGWLAVAGDPLLTAFGDDFSSWLVPLFLTCVAVILIAPLAATVAVLEQAIRASANGRWQQGHLTVWLLSATAAWVTAVTVATVIALTVPGVREILADGEGRITFRATTYCFVQGLDDAHCSLGDEIVMWTDPPRSRTAPPLPALQPLQPLPPVRALPNRD
jgi:phage shock protein PspC (stress-responsive transcriptional regulator)